MIPRRSPLRLPFAALPFALALTCAAPEGTEPAPSRRAPLAPGANVVLISIDTLRADRIGSYGYDRPTSPAYDLGEAVRTSIAAIEDADARRPFFHFLHAYDVHCPYDPTWPATRPSSAA
ncbi:MAG TPA: hypothetical protein VM617_07840 [Thermoanaerobaculia bacterium]|nr:hypothetical protein [Thermoanaerobaculia bacterium]